MKIFEKIVREQLNKFFTDNNWFSPEQYGFKSGRSCLSAFLDTFNTMLLHFSDDSSTTCVDMIYIDFVKAFDKVDHGVLIMHKLKGIGVSENLGVWMGNFLRERNQCALCTN